MVNKRVTDWIAIQPGCLCWKPDSVLFPPAFTAYRVTGFGRKQGKDAKRQRFFDCSGWLRAVDVW
jgi:hypothetical protein